MGDVDDLLVRPATTADGDAVRRVVQTAFGDRGAVVADLVHALDASGHTRASQVAVRDGVVLGHV